MYLQEAEGKSRPDPEGGGQQVARSDAEHEDGVLGVGEPVGEEDDDADELDAGAGVAEEGGELLAQVRDVTAETADRRHGRGLCDAPTAPGSRGCWSLLCCCRETEIKCDAVCCSVWFVVARTT